MKIALISDVHANEPALRAVVEQIQSRDPDLVVCVGDIVGYGPNPAACLELVRDFADIVVAGNHDRTTQTPEQYAHHPTAGPGLQHAAEELDSTQLQWLRELPDRSTIGQESILIVHSHPDPARQGAYVHPDKFENVGKNVDTDFLILGHTHVQHAEQVDGTLVVNPGSVGQPRDGNPKAAYAVVDTTDQSANLQRVAYDIGCVRDDVEAAGLPEKAWQRLQDGN
ncbi:metallophosphoesterase family protein [Haloprofundus marisrubri]|uniref:metallophosphoesterase family protein n=1 Tax=Haloprofundus marisrubri TaxID=1514971 RepID=UPI0009E5222B|nr:metallophosphoesterase family protein [Haloprofundus marisrubri]